MNAKLTLRLDDALIASAKAYAAQQGRSLSEIVGQYFTRLSAVDARIGETDVDAAKPHSSAPLARGDWRSRARPSRFLGVAQTNLTYEQLQEERYEALARKHD